MRQLYKSVRTLLIVLHCLRFQLTTNHFSRSLREFKGTHRQHTYFDNGSLDQQKVISLFGGGRLVCPLVADSLTPEVVSSSECIKRKRPLISRS